MNFKRNISVRRDTSPLSFGAKKNSELKRKDRISQIMFENFQNITDVPLNIEGFDASNFLLTLT